MPNTSDHHLESTADELEDSIKKHSTTGAGTSISSWIKTLSSHKELKPIADDLEKLKDAISEKNGAEIVKLLDKLGNETSKAGGKVDGDTGKKIVALGKVLISSAKAVKTLVK